MILENEPNRNVCPVRLVRQEVRTDNLHGYKQIIFMGIFLRYDVNEGSSYLDQKYHLFAFILRVVENLNGFEAKLTIDSAVRLKP